MLPFAPQRATHCERHSLGGLHGVFIVIVGAKRLFIAGNQFFEHVRGGDAGQIRTARRHRQGQTQAHEIVRGIADNGLI
ncbi:MAG: hypothetical protein WAU68_12085 [Vitreimonas sp.]